MTTTVEQIAAVAAMADPVGRNAAITASYRALAADVAAVLGPVDVNWLAFGAWASATAGRAIRRDSLPVDWGTSRSVAAGNAAIIADIGPRFAVWTEHVARDGRPSADALRHTLAHPLFDGAPMLANAFAGFHEAAAIAAADPMLRDPLHDKRHAELVLRSNIEVAAHEQQLADGFIDSAMPLGGLAALVTTRFVSVITPDGDVDVCRDVPRPTYLNGEQYPPVVARLEDPALVDLVTSFGQDPGLDTSASDAWSWEDYDERMGYIVCFFRSYLREQRYYDQPPR